MNLSPFEHQFIRTFKATFGPNSYKKFLVAVSGGADSMACLLLFKQFQPMFDYEFRVAHVHHGDSQSKDTQAFRKTAHDFVKQFCLDHKIEFVSNAETQDLSSEFISSNKEPSENHLITDHQSEQELREIRYSYFNQWLHDGEILVLGHHLEDKLETQFMDLLRGSHFDHWQNLKAYTKGKFRPLYQVKKQELEEHLVSKNQTWITDPSNTDQSMTRNWLRHKIFKDLEERFPKALDSLSQNLQKVYEYEAPCEQEGVANENEERSVSFVEWMLFTYSQKQKFVLRSYLGLCGKSLTQGQIEEIIRHLDKRENGIIFQTGPIFWAKTADRLNAYREIT